MQLGFQTRRQLIPAHAGVIPIMAHAPPDDGPYPRACGGDPKQITAVCDIYNLSPRMRG